MVGWIHTSLYSFRELNLFYLLSFFVIFSCFCDCEDDDDEDGDGKWEMGMGMGIGNCYDDDDIDFIQ